MVNIETRQMTPEEQSIIAGWEKPVANKDGFASGALGFSCAALILIGLAGVGALVSLLITMGCYAIWDPANLGNGWWGLFPGAGIAILAGVYFLLRRDKSRTNLSQALTEHQVKVLHCTAIDAIRIEVPEDGDEDLWSGYLVQIDTDRLLFLDDYSIGEAVLAAGKFPCDQFDLVLLPHADTVVRVICTGTPFTPSRTKILDTERESIPQGFADMQGRLDAVDDLLKLS